MRYEIVGKGTPPRIAILCPKIQVDQIKKHYLDPHFSLSEQVMICDLHINYKKKKTPASEIKEYLNDLLPNLQDMGIELLVFTQPEYFKVISKQGKTDATIGDMLDGVGGFKVTYCPNYGRVFYDPDKTNARIRTSWKAVEQWCNGIHTHPGDDIIHFAAYPKTDTEILQWLDRLYDMQCDLTCDIEGFSLKHYDAGIGTITFCWNKHEGIAFPVDEAQDKPNHFIRAALKVFFEKFQHRMIYHNICYDAYVLVYQLFMDHLLDQEGLLTGLEVMLKNWECTQLITYLATNSCAGNELGLKVQAQEFAGNYAVEDIEDITKIPLDDLLRYNLVDGLSTWYVYEKHWQTMIDDLQEPIYLEIFKKAVVDIIQMQLTGMPLNMEKVKKLDKQLNHESEELVRQMKLTNVVKGFTHVIEDEAIAKHNLGIKTEKSKKTRKDLGTIKALQVGFNPNSAPQLQRLLYDEDFLGLPVLDYTDSKLPSTGADTLEKLLKHNISQETKDFLEILMEYKASAIIISTFLPAFLKAEKGNDGWHYLFGNFRLGGTLSGRLSSNNPNLQNIPSSAGAPLKARLATLIKECFEAPPGWLFCGLDFDSLEDKISAVTTRDPEKIKIYRDGFDGHCYRAYHYWPDEMPDIDPNDVESVNSIKKKYKQHRKDSKAPTFALTYQGTFATLMNNCGFSKELAQAIENSYKKLYKVSIEWVDRHLEQATKDGYVTVAFGLRVRTPLLKQVVWGSKKTPREAQAEGRSAGNALGQSWCMLNNRAASEFMAKVRKSEYRLDIKPCAHIHDAQYYLVRDAGYGPLMYLNKHLPKAVSWQEDPLIQNEWIKMSGAVDVFYPNWNHDMTLKNDCSLEEIKKAIANHNAKLREKGIAA